MSSNGPFGFDPEEFDRVVGKDLYSQYRRDYLK